MPEKKVLYVRDKVQGEYTRTITSQRVTFKCQRCGKESSREQFPGGRPPKYCPLCRIYVEAEQNAARQKRHRERHKEQEEPPSPTA